MRNFEYLAWLLALLSSCTLAERESDKPVQILDATQPCNKPISPRELFTDVEYIKLKSPEQFFLTEAKKILEINDKLIILDKNKKIVVAYDKHGNLLGHVGRKGTGPEEYQSVFDIAVDAKRQAIIIFSSADQAILEFDTSLQFVQKVRINRFSSQMTLLESGNLAFYGYPEGGAYNIGVYNLKGELIEEHMKFPEGEYAPVDFSGCLNGNFYTYPLSSRIFKLKEGKPEDSALYEVKFQGMRPENEKFEHTKFMNNLGRDQRNVFSNFSIGAGGNELLFYYQFREGAEVGFTLGVKLANGRVFGHSCLKHGAKSNSDLFVKLFFTGPYNLPAYSQQSGYYYTAATLESMDAFFSGNREATLASIRQLDEDLYEVLDDFRDYENPIVMKFKLRENYE
ncbi:MAG: 6-bladed beta-propeller [Sediminibacterium sp.]